MMYIPLNAVIVALIYQDSYDTDTPFPKTMTQLFDALTRALVRRHLTSTHQISINFCMPPSIQHMEDISKLPSLVPEHFLKLARVAYESLGKRKYVFTDVDEDLILGMMKKTTSLNIHIGRECSYTFLHLTLQEYMAALHIALVYPSDFDLDWLIHERVVVRFLAGICRHDDYHSHPLHLELIRQLGSNLHAFQLVHCAYECPSIMHSVKCSKDDVLHVKPLVSFDWYVTGYCISRFYKRWELTISDSTCMREESIDLLVKGLKSSPNINGDIHILHLVINDYKSVDVSTKLVVAAVIKLLDCGNVNPEKLAILPTFIQLLPALLPNVTSLTYLEITDGVSDSDLPILTNIVQSHPTLEVLNIHDISWGCNSTKLSSLVEAAGSSQLKKLTIDQCDIIELLNYENTNPKELIISSQLLQPLSSLLLNITSPTYLKITGVYLSDSDLTVLTNIVQSNPTLEVLEIKEYIFFETEQPSSLVIAAGNSQLKELRLHKLNYDQSPLHIKEAYKHLLKPQLSGE